MKKVIVNIEEATVTINNQTCSFYEAGLYVNADGDFSNITDKDEIIEHLTDREEVEEKAIIFED